MDNAVIEMKDLYERKFLRASNELLSIHMVTTEVLQCDQEFTLHRGELSIGRD